MFAYLVKTEKTIARGDTYYTAVAHGTKQRMFEYASAFDSHPETIASQIINEKDGTIVHSFNRGDFFAAAV